jgi:hypothetical protein
MGIYIRMDFIMTLKSRVEKCTTMEYTHFPNTIIVILHTPLDLMFIYCIYKYLF